MAGPNNPFTFARTVTGRDFVDRADELARLTGYCTADANVLLLAPRRLGKSSLIRETFRRLEAKRVLCVYVDVQRSVDEGEVAQALLNELGRVAFGRVKRGWLWLLEQFSARRPSYTLDPQTGLPSLTLQKVEAGLPNLADVLRLVEKTAHRRKRRIVVAIDEFQTLMERDVGDRTISTMRSIIQHQKGTAYVFSGSKKHVLLRLVREPDNPLWGQLHVVEIGGIPIHHFATLAAREFAAAGRPLFDAALERIGQLCEDNPKRIQQVFFELYAAQKPPTPGLVDASVRVLVDGERHRFEDLLADIKEGDQKRLLMALAREDSAMAITGKEFVQRHGLGSASNVQYAARRLQERGVLNEHNRFVDPFFYQFLRNPPHAP